MSIFSKLENLAKSTLLGLGITLGASAALPTKAEAARPAQNTTYSHENDLKTLEIKETNIDKRIIKLENENNGDIFVGLAQELDDFLETPPQEIKRLAREKKFEREKDQQVEKILLDKLSNNKKTPVAKNFQENNYTDDGEKRITEENGINVSFNPKNGEGTYYVGRQKYIYNAPSIVDMHVPHPETKTFKRRPNNKVQSDPLKPTKVQPNPEITPPKEREYRPHPETKLVKNKEKNGVIQDREISYGKEFDQVFDGLNEEEAKAERIRKGLGDGTLTRGVPRRR